MKFAFFTSFNFGDRSASCDYRRQAIYLYVPPRVGGWTENKLFYHIVTYSVRLEKYVLQTKVHQTVEAMTYITRRASCPYWVSPQKTFCDFHSNAEPLRSVKTFGQPSLHIMKSCRAIAVSGYQSQDFVTRFTLTFEIALFQNHDCIFLPTKFMAAKTLWKYLRFWELLWTQFKPMVQIGSNLWPDPPMYTSTWVKTQHNCI